MLAQSLFVAVRPEAGLRAARAVLPACWGGGGRRADSCPAGDSPTWRPRPYAGSTLAQLRHCCQGGFLPLYHFLPLPNLFTATVEREAVL